MEVTVLKALDWKTSGPTHASLLDPLLIMLGPQLEAVYDVHLDNFKAYAQQLCTAAMQGSQA